MYSIHRFHGGHLSALPSYGHHSFEQEVESFTTGFPLGSTCFASRNKLRQLQLSRDHSRPCFFNGDLSDGKSYTTVVPLGFTCFASQNKLKQLQYAQDHSRPCSLNGDLNAYELSDSHSTSPEREGSGKKSASRKRESFSSKEILEKLRRYGIAGILSYGLLNTVYYLSAFLLVWFYVAPAPGRMGYLAAVERFLKLMAMVWAGSQVTKLVRAAGALALAPIVDRGLSWFTVKFNFKSQGKAFIAIVGFCFGLAFMMFLAVTLLSA